VHLQLTNSHKPRSGTCDDARLLFDKSVGAKCDVDAEPDSEKPFRILIADRDPMSSSLLADALVREAQFAAEAIQSARLMRTLAAKGADLVIIGTDLNSDARSSFDLSQAVSRAYPQVRILILLSQSARDSVIRSFRSGACGVVSREQPMAELLECIGWVRRGFIWAGGQEAGFLLQAVRSLPAPDLLENGSSVSLTDRELQVVKCAATGLTNRLIAAELRLSEHTVKNYLFRAFEKLGVSSRVELLFYLTLNGYNLGSAAIGESETEVA
jgi:DNA-binding NarL/FixJ family response regulator